MSIALNSDVLRGLSAALLVILVILYIMNWGFTIWRIVTGVALGIPQQRDKEDEEARKKTKDEHERLYGKKKNNEEEEQQLQENQQDGNKA